MNLRITIRVLLLAALGLPAAQLALFWTGHLLGAMDDGDAARAIENVGMVIRVLWLLVLLALLIAVGIDAANRDGESSDDGGD